MKRNHVNKNKSAKRFNNDTRKVKKANLTSPMRGGIRL